MYSHWLWLPWIFSGNLKCNFMKVKVLNNLCSPHHYSTSQYRPLGTGSQQIRPLCIADNYTFLSTEI